LLKGEEKFNVRRDEMHATETIQPSDLKVISLGSLLGHRFRRREDIITPWLRQGESAMIWAPPGAGKTLLTLTLALMVAGGGKALGWEAPKPRRVLLMDGEMAAEDLQERLERLQSGVEGLDLEAAKKNLMIIARTWQKPEVIFPNLAERETDSDREAGQDVMKAKVMKHRPELVLIDNFSTTAEVPDENDASAMTPVLALLMWLKQVRKACVLVHHSGKTGEDYRGSSKLATTFEAIIGLRPQESSAMSNGGATFRIEWTKFRRRRSEATRSRVVQLREGELGWQWDVQATEDDEIDRMLEALKTCLFTTQTALGQHLGWTDRSKVTRMRNRAIEQGRITREAWDLYLEGTGEPEF
jgi:KaiC/GvpD/RAD55 family RecA-like ATPase